MSMVNDEELAAIIARGIFEAPEGIGSDKVQRIQFKGGHSSRETDLGGFCETALARCIEQLLNKHRSY